MVRRPPRRLQPGTNCTATHVPVSRNTNQSLKFALARLLPLDQDHGNSPPYPLAGVTHEGAGRAGPAHQRGLVCRTLQGQDAWRGQRSREAPAHRRHPSRRGMASKTDQSKQVRQGRHTSARRMASMRRRFSASLPPPGILTLKGPAHETAPVSRPSATSTFVRDASERVRRRVSMAGQGAEAVPRRISTIDSCFGRRAQAWACNSCRAVVLRPVVCGPCPGVGGSTRAAATCRAIDTPTSPFLKIAFVFSGYWAC